MCLEGGWGGGGWGGNDIRCYLRTKVMFFVK